MIISQLREPRVSHHNFNFLWNVIFRGENLEKFVGKIDVSHPPEEHDIKAEEILYIHMPWKKEEPQMTQSLRGLFHKNKGKNIKITIEEIK